MRVQEVGVGARRDHWHPWHRQRDLAQGLGFKAVALNAKNAGVRLDCWTFSLAGLKKQLSQLSADMP